VHLRRYQTRCGSSFYAEGVTTGSPRQEAAYGRGLGREIVHGTKRRAIFKHLTTELNSHCAVAARIENYSTTIYKNRSQCAINRHNS
jgi:hypothetical protein